MLNVKIYVTGTLKEQYYKDAIAEYKKRLNAYCKLEIIEYKEFKLPDDPSQFMPDNDFSDTEYRLDLDEFEVDYTPDAEPELDIHLECSNFFAPGGKLASIAAINGRPAEERPFSD